MMPERQRNMSPAAKNAAMFEKCRLLLEQMKNKEFFGELTIRIKRGEVFQINVQQSFTVESQNTQLTK